MTARRDDCHSAAAQTGSAVVAILWLALFSFFVVPALVDQVTFTSSASTVEPYPRENNASPFSFVIAVLTALALIFAFGGAALSVFSKRWFDFRGRPAWFTRWSVSPVHSKPSGLFSFKREISAIDSLGMRDGATERSNKRGRQPLRRDWLRCLF